MHNITLDKSKKTMLAAISGNIDVSQANTMLADFKKAAFGINTKEFILIINPENISANLFVIPILQSFISLISEMRFKRIFLINTDKYAALIKQQLANTGVGESISFASSIKEAMKNI